LQDDPQQDTGYLILSLTETMEESRRLRQELKSGAKPEKPETQAGGDGPPEPESPPGS
jgi:hypothetical protein